MRYYLHLDRSVEKVQTESLSGISRLSSSSHKTRSRKALLGILGHLWHKCNFPWKTFYCTPRLDRIRMSVQLQMFHIIRFKHLWADTLTVNYQYYWYLLTINVLLSVYCNDLFYLALPIFSNKGKWCIRDLITTTTYRYQCILGEACFWAGWPPQRPKWCSSTAWPSYLPASPFR